MSKLQTKSGATKFSGHVQVPFENAELIKRDNRIYVVKGGEELGELAHPNVVAKGKKYLSTELESTIDPASLVGKDPTTLTHEELVALTQYLQDVAGKKVEKKTFSQEQSEKGVKSSKKAPVVEEEEEDETEEIGLPEGIETYEDLAALGSKELWKDVVKPIVGELEGITSRSKKDEMLAAAAEYYELEPTDADEDEEEEEEVKPSKSKGKGKKAPVVEEEDEEDDEEEEEDEDDLGDEFEDEDEDSEDDEDEEDDLDDEEEDEEDDDDYKDDEEEEDDEDEEEDEDDEDYDEDEDEDEEEDDEEDEVTEKDVDNLFKAGDKKAIVAFCKEHDITLPKKKLSAAKVKQIIKEALFGEE